MPSKSSFTFLMGFQGRAHQGPAPADYISQLRPNFGGQGINGTGILNPVLHFEKQEESGLIAGLPGTNVTLSSAFIDSETCDAYRVRRGEYMRTILLFTALVLGGLLAACGSDPTPTSVPTIAPTPTATSVPAAEPTPAPGAPGHADTDIETQGQRVDGGVLIVQGSDPPTLDPHQTGDVTSARYILEVFGGLLTIDPHLQIVPDLADEWAVDADGLGYVITLNPDAKFHDGRPVTAEDFKWSIERAADPATEAPAADVFLGDIIGASQKLNGEADSVFGVSVIDSSTVRVDIDAPKPYLLSKLTYPTAFVVDRDNVETGRDWTRAPNGTGPFMLTEYQPGEVIRLERFPDYHLGPAYLDAVEFNLAGGDGPVMYENDEIHLAGVGGALLESLQEPTNPLGVELHRGPAEFDVAYFGMNLEEPPFDDVKVRQALNYVIDRVRLADVLLNNVVTPANGILPPGFPAYNPALDGYEYDPEKARQLLAESKYGSDTATYPTIVLTLPGSFGSSVSPTTEAILATWEEQLGITLELQQTEWATYLQDLRDRRFQIFGGLGWVADYLDPENFLDGLFHSESDNNHTGYRNLELDALLERARVEQDQEARFALYNQAEQFIVDEAPWAPLWHSNGDSYLIKPYVKGMVLSPLVIPRFRYVYFIE